MLTRVPFAATYPAQPPLRLAGFACAATRPSIEGWLTKHQLSQGVDRWERPSHEQSVNVVRRCIDQRSWFVSILSHCRYACIMTHRCSSDKDSRTKDSATKDSATKDSATKDSKTKDSKTKDSKHRLRRGFRS